MDPNQTLKELRALAAEALRANDTLMPGTDQSTGDDRAEEMATLFQALDEWLTRRGFLPLPWQCGRQNGGNAMPGLPCRHPRED